MVALLVSLLAVALLIGSAFVVDLGTAYTSKRQLQTAADAAALAAAKRFAQEPGTCAQMKAGFSSQAEAVAVAMAESNRPQHHEDAFVVTCLTSGPYDGALQVTYRASGTTPTVFGRALVGDTITTARQASAVVYVPGSSQALRPYGLCSLDVPSAASMPSAVLEVKGPGQAWGGSGCPGAQAGGNWWFMSCPGTAASGMTPHEVADAIRNGCANGAQVVTPQDASTPAALSRSLTLNCSVQADVSPSCLDADTGNSSLQNPDPVSAWGEILGKTIVVPVFCTAPTCSPTTVDGSGTQRVYPVFKMAAVVVCGYHMYDKGSASTNTGDCAGNTFTSTYASLLGCSSSNDACIPVWNPDGTPAPNAKPKETARLFLKFVREITGVTVVKCDVGTACDGGVRQIAMSQ